MNSPPKSPPPPPILWALSRAARLNLPGIAKLLRRAGAWDQPRWTTAPARETRGLWHGYRMRLELSDFHQRGAYFYGRLLDPAVQAFTMQALQPGDDCLDLGANIGLLTLAAARAVGPKGRVLAIEPNPDVFKTLEYHIETNHLAHVKAVCAAASDRERTMTLSIPPTGNTGAGSLGKLLPRHGDRTAATYQVPLRITEDLVREAWGKQGGESRGQLFVKIDVEGHETAALRGLTRTIEKRWPIILAEVNPYMLGTNGSSAEEFFALLHGWGYRAHWMQSRRSSPLRRPNIRLVPLPESWRGDKLDNAVFVRDSEAGRAPIKAMFQA